MSHHPCTRIAAAALLGVTATACLIAVPAPTALGADKSKVTGGVVPDTQGPCGFAVVSHTATD